MFLSFLYGGLKATSRISKFSHYSCHTEPVEVSPWAIHSIKGISHCVRNDRDRMVGIENQTVFVVVVGGQTALAGGGKPLPYGYTVIYPYS